MTKNHTIFFDTPNLYADFLERSLEFVRSATSSELSGVFPGCHVSAGDCFFPEVILVDREYSSFLLQTGEEEPVSLCFSKIIFVGTVEGEDGERDISEYVSCTQSSYHPHLQNKAAGISGEFFANNVHTEKEVAPWWKASFPPGVTVKYIYLYRRVDWMIVHEKHLRLTGVTQDGQHQTLFYPEGEPSGRERCALKLTEVVESLKGLRQVVDPEHITAFDQAVEYVLSEIMSFFSVRAVDKKTGWQASFLNACGSLFKTRQDSGKMALTDPVPFARREQVADTLLQALYQVMGGAKDFGYSREDGLSVSFAPEKVQSLRIRVFGDLLTGFGGLELFNSASDEAVKVFEKQELGIQRAPEGYLRPKTFKRGLMSKLQTLRLDFDAPFEVSSLLLWNRNRQFSGNTLFVEVSVKSDPDQPWKVVYDHGATYKHICNILKLADYLLCSRWTPSYARLIGKLFTQYRRRLVMKPLAKLVRNKPDLNKAVFEGAKEIPPQTKYAAPLVLGKHGLQVPVAYRPEKKVMAHLVEVRDKVRSLGHAPLFMYGTLLGAIREKDFIPHDDDLDLAVIIDGAGPDDLMTECDRLIKVFNDAGVKCKPGSLIAPLIHCHRGPVTIDIFVLGHKDEKVYWPHTALKVVPERADIFLPATTIEFKGEIFDAPADPEAVCEARYGADWHIPNPAFEF